MENQKNMVGNLIRRITRRVPSLTKKEKEFIKENQDFWSNFPARTGKKILIEKPSLPQLTYKNALFTIVLNQAKSFTPVWFYNPDNNIELLRSYVSTAEYLKPVKSPFNIFRTFVISIWKFLKMYKTKDILSFSYDGVKYGDIIYDTYLEHEKVATIKNINLKLLGIIYICIYRHEYFKKILNSDTFKAVLVTHQVTIHSGVMLRTALRYGYKGYLLSGNLKCFEGLDEVYNYPNKPSPEEIDHIIAKLGEKLDSTYESILNRQISGGGNKFAQDAFSKDLNYYKNRYLFNSEHGLDPEKKNIFIMLHAFTDFPHSHFRWMIFNDYYDWFIQTLNFAVENDHVNWIFKQHPSIKYYPTKDVSFDSLFLDTPDNVIYINENNQIDTRSLIHCADLVITCLGSAGFEMPAMAGIPSITAGDNFYTNLGFAIEPKTKNEYFETLKNAKNIERLTPEQQKRARAAFIFIHYLSNIDETSSPICSMEEEKEDTNAREMYLNKVLGLYETKKAEIKKEIIKYISEVAKPEFKRLSRYDIFFKS